METDSDKLDSMSGKLDKLDDINSKLDLYHRYDGRSAEQLRDFHHRHHG